MRIFIIDNGLYSMVGHFYNMALGFQAAAHKRNIEARFFINSHASTEISQSLEAEAIFPFDPWDHISKDPLSGPLEDMMAIGNRFARQCSALVVNGLTRNDIVLLPCALLNELYGCGLWLKRMREENRPRLVINFMQEGYLHEASGNVMAQKSALYRYAAKSLPYDRGDGRLLLTAQSRLAADRLKTILRRPVHQYPVPMAYNEVFDKSDSLKINAPSDILLVSALGHSKVTKGFHLLPDIVRLTHETAPHIRFLIQITSKQLWKDSPDFIRSAESVEFHLGTMEPSEYIRAIAKSDIILLPYDPLCYAGKASGIFTEALALGKVVVVPDDTWMATHLHSGFGGGVCFQGHEPASIAQALVDASRDFDHLRTNAEASIQSWRRDQGVDAYLERMLIMN